MDRRIPRTALVVDDSAGARRRIGTLLRLGGWRVHDVVGMEAALRQAAVLDLDLVVTDMRMRHGNGPLLMRALRENGCRARFLAVSSEVNDDVRARAAAADATALLVKPVDPRQLVAALVDLAREPVVRDEVATVGAVHISAERLDLLEQMHAALPPRPARASEVARPPMVELPAQATRR